MTEKRFLAAAIIFFFSLTLYSLGISNRPFFTKGEGREAVVVLDMWQTGNYILPLRNGEEIPSKPPLFHWLAVGLSKIHGSLSEFTIRFPTALCAALLAAATYLFLSHSPALALVAVLILLTTSEVSRNASHARVDMCFAFFVVLATQALFKFYELRTNARRSLGWLAVATIAGACAVLAKGPAGLLFPWVIFGLYVFSVNGFSFARAFRSLPAGQCLIAVLLTIALGGVWYWAAYQQQGNAFLEVQLLRENAARIMSIEGQGVGHRKPFYFSLIYLLTGFLPWSLFVPIVLSHIWQKRKHLGDEENKYLLFSLIWLTIFVAVVGISQSKRSVYLLPALPALSYLTALALRDVAERRICLPKAVALSKGLVLCFAAIFILVVPLTVAVLFAGIPSFVAEPLREQATMVLNSFSGDGLLIASVLFIIAAVVVTAFQLQRDKFSAAIKSLFVAAVLIILLGNVWALPLLSSVAPEIQLISALNKMGIQPKLVLYKDIFYPLIFYHGSDIRRVRKLENLLTLSDESVVVAQRNLSEAAGSLPAYRVTAAVKSFVLDEEDQLYLLSPAMPGVQETALDRR